MTRAVEWFELIAYSLFCLACVVCAALQARHAGLRWRQVWKWPFSVLVLGVGLPLLALETTPVPLGAAPAPVPVNFLPEVNVKKPKPKPPRDPADSYLNEIRRREEEKARKEGRKVSRVPLSLAAPLAAAGPEGKTCSTCAKWLRDGQNDYGTCRHWPGIINPHQVAHLMATYQLTAVQAGDSASTYPQIRKYEGEGCYQHVAAS